MLNYFKENKRYIHILNHILDFGLMQVDKIDSGITIHCLSYTANIMPADALVTLVAMASAGMVLTPRVLH